jgi:hypothetical protein
MIEILLEDLLNKIHTKSFSDPKQVSEELGRLIIKDNLTQEQFAYCSSKIFNSELNLFGFINDNYMEKDKHIVNLRKEILVIISDYLQVAKIYLINYLVFIRVFSPHPGLSPFRLSQGHLAGGQGGGTQDRREDSPEL